MPKLKPKQTPTTFVGTLHATAGAGSKDFFALAQSRDYDEVHRNDKTPTQWSPSEGFTHVLHYQNRAGNLVGRVPDKLWSLWWNPAGKAYAVGEPPGMFEIDSKGVREIAFQDLDGALSCVWGADEDHLFICGSHYASVLYRKTGAWKRVTLPEETDALWGVGGCSERDVYIVGDGGTVLHFDGSKISLLERVTTRHLLSVCALDDRSVCIGGYDGTLLYGNRKGFRKVPSGTGDPILWLAKFQDKVCYATADGLYGFDGKKQPALIIDQAGAWAGSAGDAVTINDDGESWLYDGKDLFQLDTIV